MDRGRERFQVVVSTRCNFLKLIKYSHFQQKKGTLSVFLDWWLASRKSVAKSSRKVFNTSVILTAWKLWLLRNDKVFNGKAEPTPSVIKNIIEEVRCWISADMADLSLFIFPNGYFFVVLSCRSFFFFCGPVIEG